MIKIGDLVYVKYSQHPIRRVSNKLSAMTLFVNDFTLGVSYCLRIPNRYKKILTPYIEVHKYEFPDEIKKICNELIVINDL